MDLEGGGVFGMVVSELGVPRSTAIGWLRSESRRVVTAEVPDMDHVRPQVEVLNLRQRLRRLGAVIRLRAALIRALGVRLDQAHMSEGDARTRLVRALKVGPGRPKTPCRGGEVVDFFSELSGAKRLP